MSVIVGVQFRGKGKEIWFNALTNEIFKKDDAVLVDMGEYTDLGFVKIEPKDVDLSKFKIELKNIVKKATSTDLEKYEKLLIKEKNSWSQVMEKIKKHNLNMKLVEIKCVFDNSRIIISYTSDDRVDFRELVRDLAGTFKTRVELRQIGSRDEAKFCGGYGCCGQELCCRKFLNDYKQVTIKMAKTQNLSLNPNKINGVCGKLMCCLQYEYETYKELSENMPSLETVVETKDGEGVVKYQDILQQKVIVELSDTKETKEYKTEEIQFNKKS